VVHTSKSIVSVAIGVRGRFTVPFYASRAKAVQCACASGSIEPL
jgi:hypothetical protein